MNRHFHLPLPLAFALSLIPAIGHGAESQPNDKQLEFFEKKIRPLFVENCYNCHSERHKEAGGLRVDDFRALTVGGKSGAAVLPGDSENSLLIKRVMHADDKKTMPPDRRISSEQIADLRKWIDDGAAWPALIIPDDADQTLDAGFDLYPNLKAKHWSWQPLKPTEAPSALPESPLANWPQGDVDRFVLDKLSEQGLAPVGDANKTSLLRRLTYDLTGLPPSQQELVAFIQDESETAYEQVVDRLLASDGYAERWGRHWLDVARYGESTGSARNLPYPHAWRYRDYVLQSFKDDKPYNQFIQEQIAGDLLPANSPSEKNDQLIATGFLALGVKDVNQRFTVRYEMDNVDEQIDTVSRAVLGLTVSCARCHDHRFDPISTRDYYALAGIFTSTEIADALRNQMGGNGLAYYVPSRLITLSDSANAERDESLQAEIREKADEVAKAKAALVQVRDQVDPQESSADRDQRLRKARQKVRRKQVELDTMNDPARRGPVAMGVRESQSIADTEIRIRGEAEKRGPVVPRGFLSVLDHVGSFDIEPGKSGRYELARWLTSDQNALTARVAVNRIWQHLFTEGLVRSVDNFGTTGDTPSHPELLEHLSAKFINEGWSIKKMIRHLVLSRTYQLSSDKNSADASHLGMAKDPANRWLRRHTPRRLDAEEVRDSILAIAGELTPGAIDDSPSSKLPVREIQNNGAEAKQLLQFAAENRHRSVYLPLLRGIVPTTLEPFDFAEQGMVTGQREVTTVAPQALFLLNDNFVISNATALARKLIDRDPSLTWPIEHAFQAVLHRQPSLDELEQTRLFLDDFQNTFAIATAATSSPHRTILVSTEIHSTGQGTDAAENRGEQADDSAESLPSASTISPEAASAREAAVTALVQSLFCSAEFRYIR